MKVVILAGGKAERMGGYPKALTFVNGYTIFERQIVWLKQGGFEPKDILIAYGDNKDICAYAKRFVPVENLFSDGGKPLGDGGAIRRAMEKYGHNRNYLVINGDILLLFGAKTFIKFCKSIKQAYLGAIVAKDMRSRYGIIELSEDDPSIISFKEKPKIGLVSCGVYFLHGAIYELLPNKGCFAESVLSKYYKKFCLYVIKENEWIPVETIKDINLAEKLLQNRKR